MELGKKVGENFVKQKDLKEFDEKTGPYIANKITIKKNDKSSENKESPFKSNTLIILNIFLLIIIINKIKLILILIKIMKILIA